MINLGIASAGERLDVSFTSYSGSFGSLDVIALPTPETGCNVPTPLVAQANGCLGDAAPIRFASISDGLAETLLVAEKATTKFRKLDDVDPLLSSRYGWYFSGNMGDTLFTAFYPPNTDMKVAAIAGPTHAFAASSLHPGGFNVLLGDGSVHFVTDSINTWPFDQITGQPVGATRSAGNWWDKLPPYGVWQKLATRAGGELVDGSSY